MSILDGTARLEQQQLDSVLKRMDALTAAFSELLKLAGAMKITVTVERTDAIDK